MITEREICNNNSAYFDLQNHNSVIATIVSGFFTDLYFDSHSKS